MLLKALYDFYERACIEGKIEDTAFAEKPIRWLFALNAQGELLGVIEQADENNKPIRFKAPRTNRSTVSGRIANFLAEGMDAVFGLNPEPFKYDEGSDTKKKSDLKREVKHAHFWEQIELAAQAVEHSQINALLNFRNKMNGTDAFFRSESGIDAKGKQTHQWWIKTASDTEAKFGGADNITFQVEGSLLISDESIQKHWRDAFAEEASDEEEKIDKGICLVTGQMNAPIMRTHRPLIANVPGAKQQSRLLVSFEGESFKSYGFDKSYNAPVSSSAVTAYTNALNWLLRQRNHTVRIADTVLCFWARESDAVTDMFAFLFDTPKPESVRTFLHSPFSGIANASELKSDDFFSVTLGGNAGRVVVRHWMQSSIDVAVKNLQRWFEDLNVVTLREQRSENDTPLSLYRLALATVREAKNLQADTMTQLYVASLEGRAPSLTLAAKLIDRLKTDLAREGADALYNLSRFALLRLILNRHRKEDTPVMTPQLSDTDDAAYNCGRLLAIFDDLQMAAHDYKLEGAGVVERYYGAACSSPNSAFGILWRLHQHHLKKVARQGEAGRAKAEAIKNKIADIATRFRQTDARFPPQFPRAFDLQQQGRFALGFYQQKAFERAARQSYLDAKRQQPATAHGAQAQSESQPEAFTPNSNEAPINSMTTQGEATSGQ